MMKKNKIGYDPLINIIHYETGKIIWDLDIAKKWEGGWIFLTTKIKAEGTPSKATREIMINPYWHLKYYANRVKWHSTHLYLWATKQLHKRCWGCGEGIAVWRIKDPNNKFESDERIFVCDGCVNFYDWHWSKKPAVMKAKRK